MGSSGEDCLLEFGHLLGPQEMREILAYREVYFVGTEQSKKIRETQIQNNNAQKDRLRGHTSRSPQMSRRNS